jgi:glycosyltransferase involved in cell wall biosynthesis
LKRPIRTLLFSTLYPSAARPAHGIFVETRLRELLKTGEVEARVVAPVPWFPFRGKRFGEYARMAATPRHELRNGIEVSHPRYPLPPRIGMTVAPYLLAQGALPVVRKLMREGFDFDLIDAHYYYPDGVAAAAIARALNKPFVITARGTDLNLIPEFPRPRQRILETAAGAAASIGVCKALMDCLAAMGADPGKLHVLRNGVDLERFVPMPRDQSRARLGMTGGAPVPDRVILSVGHLIERKGHHIAIEALVATAPSTRLYVVGEGGERAALQVLAGRLGVAARVHFTGAVPQDELKWWYSAADALVLCSSREGWANVLLESMACGTPVVATNIWGTPEVVSTPAAGVLMRERSPAALAEGLERLFTDYPGREAVRRHAEGFSWQETSQGQLELFRAVLADIGSARAGAWTQAA